MKSLFKSIYEKYNYEYDKKRLEFEVESKEDEEFFDIEKNREFYDRVYKIAVGEIEYICASTATFNLYNSYKNKIDKILDYELSAMEFDETEAELWLKNWIKVLEKDWALRKKIYKFREEFEKIREYNLQLPEEVRYL